MNLQENIHRIHQMMGVIKESEEQQPDYAVIEITKPLSYLSMKKIYVEHTDYQGLKPREEYLPFLELLLKFRKF